MYIEFLKNVPDLESPEKSNPKEITVLTVYKLFKKYQKIKIF